MVRAWLGSAGTTRNAFTEMVIRETLLSLPLVTRAKDPSGVMAINRAPLKPLVYGLVTLDTQVSQKVGSMASVSTLCR